MTPDTTLFRPTSKADLDAVAARWRAGQETKKHQLLVCAGAGCVSSGCHAVKHALLAALKDAGLAERHGRPRDRLPRLLPPRADARRPARRRPLHRAQARAHEGDRQAAPRPPRGRRGALLGRPGDEGAGPAPRGHRVLPPPDPPRHRALRLDPLRLHRGVHRFGRLPGAREGPRGDDARAGDPGDASLGPPGPRRRRLPRRRQVAGGLQGEGSREDRRLQRRRGRPGRLHGPLPPRGRPARHPRGDAHRRLRHRRLAGLRLRPRGVPARRRAPRGRDPPGARVGPPRAERHGDPVRLRRRDPDRRRRLRLRRGDGADALRRGQARRAAAEAAVPLRAGHLRQADDHQQRRDARERPRHPPQRRRLVRVARDAEEQRARRSSRSPARSRTPASSRSRWGSPSARSSTTSPAASRRGSASRRRRRAAPRAGASRAST